ncbi:MAG: hypothetical protein ABI702_19190 [Burkholderiales bacterium]
MTSGVRRHAGVAVVALSALMLATFAAEAQVSVGIDIGINVPTYPRLVRVPGYPVYYDPQFSGNYFFYDGLYWVYRDDTWYDSSWYDGPWQSVAPERVPLFVLRVPVRYYRQPPVYFQGWRADAPPRWGEHWGPAWQQRRAGWDHWNRAAAPAPAPLPVYQRRFPGERYPRTPERQTALRVENSRFQPKEAVAQQHWRQSQGRGGNPPPAPQQHAQPAPRQHMQPAPHERAQPAPRERAQPAPGGHERGGPPGDRGRGPKEPEHGDERR